MTRTSLLLASFAWLAGCGASAARPAEPSPTPSPPMMATFESATAYSTDATPGGVVGGDESAAVEKRLLAVLHGRGDVATADGRLAQVALVAASREARGLPIGHDFLEALTRRAGFVGPTPWLLTLRVVRGADDATIDAALRAQLAGAPSNVVLQRYGVATVERGFGWLAYIMVGALDLHLEPLPRQLGVHAAVPLHGVIGQHYTRSEVSITWPDGTVHSSPGRTRNIETTLDLAPAGAYQIEVNGDGPTGPIVLANFPVYVGMAPPSVDEGPTPGDTVFHERSATPEEVEAKLLSLLNGSRTEAGLTPLLLDPALSEIAREDGHDMATHGFFSHVSPFNGTLEDRLRKAGLLYPEVGENIARDHSPEATHAGLMASPGHRENVLHPPYTHVGIGVVLDGGTQISVFEFARERPIALTDVPATVRDSLNERRAKESLPPLAADAALDRFARDILDTPNPAPDPTADPKKASPPRLPAIKGGACTWQLTASDVRALHLNSLVLAKGLSRIGIAAAATHDGPETFRMVIVAGAPPGERGRCPP